MSQGLLDFPAQVTPPIVGAGLALSTVVGLVAGYFPARAASNLPRGRRPAGRDMTTRSRSGAGSRTCASPSARCATQKLRSFLTLLGVMAGVATVIMMVSFVVGFNRQVTSAFTAFGTHLVQFQKYEPRFGGRRASPRSSATAAT